jgi:formylglycine-generating enzyme required for sulfatase activity
MKRALLVCALAAACGSVDSGGADAGGHSDAAPTMCTIGGQSYADGDAKPDDPCLRCDLASSASNWSPSDDGTSCDDGLYCTGEDTCGGGRCSVHTGPSCLLCDEEGAICEGNAWVDIAAGSFTMGSPDSEVGRESNFVDETQHEVTLTRDFRMTATAVTQDEFQIIMKYNPSQFSGCADCPVEGINFYEALAFANLASQAAGLPSCYQLDDIVCGDDSAGSAPTYCRDNEYISSATVTLTAATPYDCAGYRLPTEAEREWATRAGTTTAFSDSGGIDEAHIDCATPFHLTDIAWYCGNGGGTTHPVALKAANPWGLYDLHGNAHEWTWDWYDDYPTGSVTDPTGPADGSQRTYRGGAWGDSARYSRSATRSQMEPNFRYPGNLGMRLARTAPAR